MVRSAAQLPRWLWDELADAINKVDACLPVRDNPEGKPPDAMITGTVPDLSYVKVLSCLAFVHKPAGSLESRATQGTVKGMPSSPRDCEYGSQARISGVEKP